MTPRLIGQLNGHDLIQTSIGFETWQDGVVCGSCSPWVLLEPDGDWCTRRPTEKAIRVGSRAEAVAWIAGCTEDEAAKVLDAHDRQVAS